MVRWSGERAQKALTRWRSTAREAAKQSRRLLVPAVREPVDTADLVQALGGVDCALILHEEATTARWSRAARAGHGDDRDRS